MGLEIRGHTQQRDRLRSLYLSDKLPTTLLLSGPQGIGKFLIAKEIAASLFCENIAEDPHTFYGGCGSCHSCHLLEIGNLPDLHIIDCTNREQANTDNFRSLLYSLNLSSFGGRARVVIFNDADHISIQCANILLKALEEPGKNTYFILISSNDAKLPETILSRCQVWYFDSLPIEEIKKVIEDKKEELPDLPPSAKLEELATLADGSPGSLSHVITFYDKWRELSSQLSQLSKGDISIALDLAKILSGDKEQLSTNFQLLRIEVRRCLNASPSTAWGDLLQNILESERLITERNINATYVLNTTFVTFAQQCKPTNFQTESQLLEQFII